MADCICVRRGDGPEGCGICNETGTTPDIAGLCEELRESATQVFGHYAGEPEDTLCLAPIAKITQAADTLERQAAEIERLRELLRCIRDTPANEFDAVDVANRIRAALTGEDHD
jgi:hypothetical protein